MLLLLAACAREDGDGGQALALTTRAAEAAPDWATPALWRAELLAATPDRLEDALAAAEQAVDLADEEDEFLSAVALKAGLEVELGDTNAARETLEDLPPAEVRLGDIDAALEIADLHMAVGDAETARLRLRRAVRGAPGVGRRLVRAGGGGRRAGGRGRDAVGLAADLGAGHRTRADSRKRGRSRKRSWPRWPNRPWASCPNGRASCCAASPSSSRTTRPRATWTPGWIRGPSACSAGRRCPDSAPGLGGQPGLTQIVLFRRNLERATVDADELRAEVRLTLLHETGHFFGLSDEELAELGLE